MGDNHAFGRLGPAAVFVEASEGADCPDDAIGGWGDGFGVFDDVFKGVAGAGGAALEEIEGVGVTVNHHPVPEVEVDGDFHGAPPVQEGVLDGVAFGVLADGAMGFVAFEVDFGLAGPVARFVWHADGRGRPDPSTSVRVPILFGSGDFDGLEVPSGCQGDFQGLSCGGLLCRESR